MVSNFHTDVLLNLERLNILRDLALLRENNEVTYDQLTEFAGNIIGTPVALVSTMAADYQFFKSHIGLPEPWKSRRNTPLSHSFCQHVVANNEPLIVEDAREVDLLKNNLAIPDLNVIGYLGFPLTLSNNTSLGSFCVIDGKPRKWNDNEINIIRELSEILTAEFETRAQMNLGRATKGDLTHVQNAIHTMIDTIDTQATQADILSAIQAFRKEHDI